MGQITSQESLLLRWAELCAEPQWQDLGDKVELNGLGVIEMSPAHNRHGKRQASLAHTLTRDLPHGTVIVQCSILTTDGIRVPDVAWASFMAVHGDEPTFRAAPELFVEVRSPSNTDAEMAHKTALYLQAGAVEVRIVDEDGAQQVFDRSGPRAGSGLVAAD
ncbi:MAG: Uma2 family endonuclease [Rubrivivax sp.]